MCYSVGPPRSHSARTCCEREHCSLRTQCSLTRHLGHCKQLQEIEKDKVIKTLKKSDNYNNIRHFSYAFIQHILKQSVCDPKGIEPTALESLAPCSYQPSHTVTRHRVCNVKHHKRSRQMSYSIGIEADLPPLCPRTETGTPEGGGHICGCPVVVPDHLVCSLPDESNETT